MTAAKQVIERIISLRLRSGLLTKIKLIRPLVLVIRLLRLPLRSREVWHVVEHLFKDLVVVLPLLPLGLCREHVRKEVGSLGLRWLPALLLKWLLLHLICRKELLELRVISSWRVCISGTII